MNHSLTPEQRTRVLEWADDLMSGNRRQVTGTLARNQTADSPDLPPQWGYCCLGVLSDRAEAEGVVQSHEVYFRGDGEVTAAPLRKTYGKNREPSDLPFEVSKWSGLDANPQLLVPEHLRHKLNRDDETYYGSGWVSAVSLNDIFDFSFSEIGECVKNTYGREENK